MSSMTPRQPGDRQRSAGTPRLGEVPPRRSRANSRPSPPEDENGRVLRMESTCSCRPCDGDAADADPSPALVSQQDQNRAVDSSGGDMGNFVTLVFADGTWSTDAAVTSPSLTIDIYDSDIATVDYRGADSGVGRCYLGIQPREISTIPTQATKSMPTARRVVLPTGQRKYSEPRSIPQRSRLSWRWRVSNRRTSSWRTRFADCVRCSACRRRRSSRGVLSRVALWRSWNGGTDTADRRFGFCPRGLEHLLTWSNVYTMASSAVQGPRVLRLGTPLRNHCRSSSSSR